MYALVSGKVKNLYEILSGQHRTNAGDEFVNGVKAVEAEWVAMLGKTLCPVFLSEAASEACKAPQCWIPRQRIKTTGAHICTL